MAGHIVKKIGRAAALALRAELESAGFTLRSAPHALYAASGPGVSVTYYKSGKLLVQGKGAYDFGATYLGVSGDDGAGASAAPASAADTVTEPIIGVDESGKGDYFGPLVVAAMLVRPEDVEVLATLGVRDSKTVKDREACEIGEELEAAYGERVAVVTIPPVRYNELHEQFGSNLNRLLAWGHARAIEDILERVPCGRALSDRFGNPRLIEDALLEHGQEIELQQRVRAESHPAVAAASLIARARFLRSLERLGDDVGTKLPKGAGSPVDQAARRLYREGGLEHLAKVAKMHFKTTQKAMR